MFSKPWSVIMETWSLDTELKDGLFVFFLRERQGSLSYLKVQ